MQYFSRTFMLNLLLKLKWFIKSIKKVFCFIKCESYKICAIFYFCKNYFCKNKKQQPKKQLSHHCGLCSTVQKPEAEDGWAQRLAMWFPLSVSRWQNALRDKERPSICSWRGSFSRHIAASLPHLGDFSVKYIKATFSLIPMLRFFFTESDSFTVYMVRPVFRRSYLARAPELDSFTPPQANKPEFD